MKLDIYLKSKRGLAAQVATALDCSPVLISQWCKSRPVPIERCVPIEHATEGRVMRWDLRPDDWWEIWPELIERPGAPSIPSVNSEAA